jgi:hypothetical protein
MQWHHTQRVCGVMLMRILLWLLCLLSHSAACCVLSRSFWLDGAAFPSPLRRFFPLCWRCFFPQSRLQVPWRRLSACVGRVQAYVPHALHSEMAQSTDGERTAGTMPTVQTSVGLRRAIATLCLICPSPLCAVSWLLLQFPRPPGVIHLLRLACASFADGRTDVERGEPHVPSAAATSEQTACSPQSAGARDARKIVGAL